MPDYFFFTRGRELELLMYMLACGFLIWGADNYRRLAERLQKEEDLRKLVVEELAHRLKNKIATIQSIISYQLREQPGLRNDIVARLVLLVHELATNAVKHGALSCPAGKLSYLLVTFERKGEH